MTTPGTISFFVRGVPKAQPRAKATTFTKKARRPGEKNITRSRMYDPGTADDWKMLVALEASNHQLPDPIQGPVSVLLRFIFPRPKRLLRKKDPDGLIPHAQKPDKDNLEKAVLDALTAQGMWGDDCQVYHGEQSKFFGPKEGAVPGCHVTIIHGNK